MRPQLRSEFAERYLPKIMEAVGNYNEVTKRDIDWRADAGEAIFLQQELQLIEARVYEYKLRKLKFRDLMPISGEGKGAETIGYDVIRGTGQAKVIASGADDLPLADSFIDRHYATVRVLGIAISYTTRELRNAAFASKPLEARRSNAARRGMEEKLSQIAWLGDSQYGMLGLLNHPNVPTLQAAAAAGGGASRIWGVDKTALEVVADISAAISKIVSDTNEIHVPDTIAMPVAKLRYIKQTPISATIPTMTIYKWIMDPENGFGITKIESVPEMKNSKDGTRDQMWVYERSDENFQFRIPMEMTAMAPEQRGTKFLINMEAECAGLVIRYPLSMLLVYDI